MNLIIDGSYDNELVDVILKEEYPVSHYVVYVPQNSIGSSSIFLPKNLPTWDAFEDFVEHLKQTEIIPIAQLDSTCQGNFEAFKEQFCANLSLMERLETFGIKEVLVSSPNNVGFVSSKFPDLKIYLSYTQLVTSLNRARIFFDEGANNIILHPDIVRNTGALKNFLKLLPKIESSREHAFTLPLNLGCNWGCIQWYFHHNLQSHRTMNSPLMGDQTELSDVEDEFDYPLLYCWKKRIEEPVRLLKACWISPLDLEYYEGLGYHDFLLFTKGMGGTQAASVIDAYSKKTLDGPFNEFLQIPHPYGEYWAQELANDSLIRLTPDLLMEFSSKLPRNGITNEQDLESFYQKFSKKFPKGDSKAQKVLLPLIEEKLEKLRKGAIQREK